MGVFGADLASFLVKDDSECNVLVKLFSSSPVYIFVFLLTVNVCQKKCDSESHYPVAVQLRFGVFRQTAHYGAPCSYWCVL